MDFTALTRSLGWLVGMQSANTRPRLTDSSVWGGSETVKLNFRGKRTIGSEKKFCDGCVP